MNLNDTISTYLTTAPTSDFNGMDVRVLDHWRGSENLLWRVRANQQSARASSGAASEKEAVVKLYLDAGQARSRRQFDGQDSFWRHGVAPRPLWYDRHPVGLARQVLIYEWVNGDAFDPTDTEQITSLGHALAIVHGGDPNDVRRFSPNPLNLDYLWRVMQGSITPAQAWLREQEAGALLAALSDLAARATALVEQTRELWRGAPPAPVHGDVKLENVVQQAEQITLLDWELFGLGDAALEVASFLYDTQSVLDDGAQEVWLDAYLSRVEQSNFTARVGVYQRILPLRAVLYLLDGLRALQSQPDEALDAETAKFLRETLVATLQQAAAVLGADVPSGCKADITAVISSEREK